MAGSEEDVWGRGGGGKRFKTAPTHGLGPHGPGRTTGRSHPSSSQQEVGGKGEGEDLSPFLWGEVSKAARVVFLYSC